MRRSFICVLISVSILLLFSSCGVKTKINYEYEADPRWLHMGAVAAVNNDALYLLLLTDRSRILCEDIAHSNAAYLCGKPECSHDIVTCNAYLGTEEPSIGNLTTGLGLSVIDGGIAYVFVDGADICAAYMKADGSSHQMLRKLASIESNHFPLNGGISPFFHKGYVFACGQTSEIVNGEWESTNRITAYSLHSKDEEIEVFSETCKHDFGGLLIYPVGDLIWYAVIEGDMSEDSGIIDTHLRVYTWNIARKSTKKVFDDDIPGMVYEWSITADGIYFTSAMNDAIYLLDTSRYTFDLYRKFDDAKSDFMTMYLSGNYVIGFTYPSQGMQRIRVEDLQGNELADITEEQLPLEGGGRVFLGVANERLFYITQSLDGQEEALVEFSLETKRKQVIWSQKVE